MEEGRRQKAAVKATVQWENPTKTEPGSDEEKTTRQQSTASELPVQ